jgi:uncharacterized membrane protein YoaK (UPF0700 family)
MANATSSTPRPVAMDAILTLLTFASSITDVLSFLVLGNAFTSGMTGNTALLGLAVGRGQIFTASYPASALAGFLLGVTLGGLLSRSVDQRAGLAALLGFESLCLGAFCAIWFGFAHPAGSEAIYVLIALSATGMGIQAVAARRINAPGIPTIVFTTTLTTICTAATDAVARGVPLSRDTKRQIGIFSVYLAGATIAGALSSSNLGLLALLPLIAVVAALAIEYAAGTGPDQAGT